MYNELLSNAFTKSLASLNILALLVLAAMVLFWNTDTGSQIVGETFGIEKISNSDSGTSAIYPSVLINLIERPIFHTSRRAYVPPVYETPQAPVVVERPSFKLTGIITKQDGTAWAYLQKNGDETVVRAEQGEIVDGWLVQSISEDKVVVSKNGTIIELGEVGDN
jgi:type II secretory pathway component PulC